MPKRREPSLTIEQREELVGHRDRHQRPAVREKAAALLKIAEGASPHWVAKSGLLKPRDPDTVYGWLQIYLDEGFKGLMRRQHGGARCRFSEKKAELIDCLRQSPGAGASEKAGLASKSASAPSRWTLDRLRRSLTWLEPYTFSGVHRVLSRCGLCIRSGRVQQYSPDAAYAEKVRHLCDCLRQTASGPDSHVLGSVYI